MTLHDEEDCTDQGREIAEEMKLTDHRKEPRKTKMRNRVGARDDILADWDGKYISFDNNAGNSVSCCFIRDV